MLFRDNHAARPPKAPYRDVTSCAVDYTVADICFLLHLKREIGSVVLGSNRFTKRDRKLLASTFEGANCPMPSVMNNRLSVPGNPKIPHIFVFLMRGLAVLAPDLIFHIAVK